MSVQVDDSGHKRVLLFDMKRSLCRSVFRVRPFYGFEQSLNRSTVLLEWNSALYEGKHCLNPQNICNAVKNIIVDYTIEDLRNQAVSPAFALFEK